MANDRRKPTERIVDAASAAVREHTIWDSERRGFGLRVRPSGRNPIAVKYMMRKLGNLARNEHRLPMAPATPELEERLDAVLERAGLLASRAAE